MYASIQTRRTNNLSVQEICDHLQESPEPSLVNELGVIYVGDGCPIAENALIKMLEIGYTTKFIAYCQLLRTKRLSNRARQALETFADDWFNKDIIDTAKKYLWLEFN